MLSLDKVGAQLAAPSQRCQPDSVGTALLAATVKLVRNVGLFSSSLHTDANLVLGRILPQFFPHIFGPQENEPLDADGVRWAARQVGWALIAVAS